MACEEEFMYQAYLNYLARKATEAAETMTPEEQEFLKASGFVADPAPQANFACDPVPAEAAPQGSPFSRMGPKVS
jgi:hypothetical protein